MAYFSSLCLLGQLLGTLSVRARRMAVLGGGALFLLFAQTTVLQGDVHSNKFLSICWSLGRGIDEARALWGFDIAKQEGVRRLRLYDSTPTPESFLQLAEKSGLKVTMGAWLDNDHLQDNVRQLAMLRDAIVKGLVEPTAIIGSEVLSFQKMSVDELIALIVETKKSLPEHVAVTTPELFHVLIANPRLIDAQRHIIGLHHHPFAYGVHIDDALRHLVEHYEKIKALSGNKRVVIYETSWPSDGGTFGAAVASVENQKRYYREVSAWAQRSGVEVYFFQLIDEHWKQEVEGHVHESHLGIRNADGSSKN